MFLSHYITILCAKDDHLYHKKVCDEFYVYALHCL